MKYLILLLLLLAFTLNAAPSTRKSVLNNLNTIIIKEIELNHLTIEKIIEILQEKSLNKVNFIYLPKAKPVTPALPALTNNAPAGQGVDPLTGLPLVLPPFPLLIAPVAPPDALPRIVRGNIVFRSITLKQALDICTLCFDQPMQYVVTDFGVIFMHRKDGEEGLFTRKLKVNPNIFNK